MIGSSRAEHGVSAEWLVRHPVSGWVHGKTSSFKFRNDKSVEWNESLFEYHYVNIVAPKGDATVSLPSHERTCEHNVWHLTFVKY
jgi:hypothetical protein